MLCTQCSLTGADEAFKKVSAAYACLSDADKRSSEKWQRAVNTVDWLTTQIPARSKFQMYAFNVKAIPMVEGTEGEWIEASDPQALDKALQSLGATVPTKGTSLHNAFVAVSALDPPPDNIYLLTDGLPTQGSNEPRRNTVSPSRRLGHFKSALETLPSGIPINVILYPMEGDPDAAISYWLLAQRTGGSFLSPARDWP